MPRSGRRTLRQLDRHSGERRRFDKAAVKAMRNVRHSTQCVALP